MRVRYLLLLAAIMVVASTVAAQPISLTINGVPTGATFTSGDVLSWQITLPPGAMSNNQLWVDVNQNGVVDGGTDRLIFRFFQQDGMSESDGPGDTDGMVNGTILTQFPAGLAPAYWLFVVSNGVSADTGTFHVLPLASPAATIVGQVTAPVGVDRSYILIEANAGSGGGPMNPFWHALTDLNGNFAIQLGGTPAMWNPWRVELNTSELGRLVPLSRDTSVNVGATPPVVNFQLVLGTILTGIVRDQGTNPVERAYPHVHPSADPNSYGNLGGDTGPDGRFSFVVPPGVWLLHFTKDGYKDQWWNGKTSSMTADVIIVTAQDTIKDLDGTIVKAGEIRGIVRNYGSPTNAMVYLFTMPGEAVMSSRPTNNDGSYSFTVDPGTYYVKFQKDAVTQYWNHMSSPPGSSIVVMGTETISGIDADFSVGLPPPPPGPQIVRIWDVPFDNGHQVYVKFVGVEQYLPRNTGGDGIFGIEKYTIWRLDKSELVYAGMVPAAWDSTYIGIVPTIVDSTITDGLRWSRFIVKAHFLFNIYVIPSAVDSGYSLDNLAPNVPGGVGSAVSGGNVMVAWQPNPDEDLRYYSVYRGTTDNFSVVGLTPLMRTTDPSFTDAGAATGTYYYRITATDFAGNESMPSLPVSSSGTTAVATGGDVPSVFALGQNYPNPFNPTTNIVFEVPNESYVRLEVYNALGQRVAELVAGQVMAGRHTARFDASGLPSGLYVARMTSGEFAATRKINLIK